MMEILLQLVRRLKLIASRGTVTAIDDSQAIQQLQVELLKGELRELVRVQNYGLTSVPLKGAQVVSLSLGGTRGQSVITHAEDPRYRPRGLALGEVCLYTDEGDVIHFKRGEVISIKSGGTVQVDAPTVTATCTTLTATAAASATLKAPTITLDGAVTITKTLTVTEAITGLGGLAVSGGAATVAGSLAVTGGDITADGMSVKNHTHPYDGNKTTGAPI